MEKQRPRDEVIVNAFKYIAFTASTLFRVEKPVTKKLVRDCIRRTYIAITF